MTLRADCDRCFGLCCVAPGFATSADFALDKPPGRPCVHLSGDFRCGIHEHLKERGFPGCAAYDCLGAGQQVAQVTFAGRDWRSAPETAGPMFAAFGVMRQLHELLWHLTSVVALPAALPLRSQLRGALEETERLTYRSADDLGALDLAAHGRAVHALLRRTSELARTGSPTDYRGADLAGRDLRRHPLRAADLSAAVLIGADLRGADLREADLLGADLRAADLLGADLSTTLFLTPTQVAAARTDAATKLPPALAS